MSEEAKEEVEVVTEAKVEAKPVAEENITSEKTFTLTLKNMTGGEFQIECTQSHTTAQVKQKLHEQNEHWPVACIRMLAGRKTMEDSKTLADYEITKPTKLRFVVKLMNVITLERLQGRWIDVVTQGSFTNSVSIEDDDITWYGGGCHKLVLEEDCFQYRDDKYKPIGILKDIIIMDSVDDENNIGYWIREWNENTIAEMRKRWPELTYKVGDE